MSFIYKRKRMDPNIEPWGTPWITVLREEQLSVRYKYCFRFVRYDVNLVTSESLIPPCSDFDNRILWLTESNALDRSWYIPITNFLLVKSEAAISVYLFFKRPFC